MGCILRNLKTLLRRFAGVLPERTGQALGRVGFFLGQFVGLDQRVERTRGGGAVAGRYERQVRLCQQALLDQLVEQRRVEVAPSRIGLLGRQVARIDHSAQDLPLAAIRISGRLERV